jgi:hypothetical protein
MVQLRPSILASLREAVQLVSNPELSRAARVGAPQLPIVVAYHFGRANRLFFNHFGIMSPQYTLIVSKDPAPRSGENPFARSCARKTALETSTLSKALTSAPRVASKGFPHTVHYGYRNMSKILNDPKGAF